MTINTVFFDLDGTLADTAPDLAYALNRVLEEEGRAPLPYEHIRPVVSHGGMALIRFGFGLEPEHPDFQRLRQRLLDIYRDNIARNTSLFPGMEALLDDIEVAGMKWGVITNKPAWLTDPLMDALGLTARATCIVSGDTTPKSKPHPEPMLYACRRAASDAAACVFIGDALRDIEAGRGVGMRTIAALFGYIGDTDRPQEWGADALVHHPQEIIDCIATWK